MCIQSAADREDDQAAVSFTYNPELVAYIKELPRTFRTWAPDEKVWLVPPEKLEHVVSHFLRAGVKVKRDVDQGLVSGRPTLGWLILSQQLRIGSSAKEGCG